MNKEHVLVKIKYPEGLRDAYDHYYYLQTIANNGVPSDTVYNHFVWEDTGRYLPDFVWLTNEDALVYTLAN